MHSEFFLLMRKNEIIVLVLRLRFCFPEESKVQTVGVGRGGACALKPSVNISLIFQAEFGNKVHLNSQFPGTERLPNTCNFSIRGPQLQGDDRLLLVSPVLEAGGSGLGWAGLAGQLPGDMGSGVGSCPVVGWSS